MLSTAVEKPDALSDAEENTRRAGRFLFRKIWVPKLLYSALPYFYLVSGFAAFFATLYISEWFWVLPHYLLFSAVCIHLGVLIARRRHKARNRQA